MATSPQYVEAWLPGFDNHQFYTRTWAAAQPKAVLLYIHGFADHISRYDHVHCEFPKRGITVFAYDKRGYGKTALDVAHRSPNSVYGRTNLNFELQDLEWWIEHIAREHPGVPIFVLGYSASGGMLFIFATRQQTPPKPETLAKVAGIIGGSPLLRLTYPPPAWKNMLARSLCGVLPNLKLPAPMPEERFSRIPAKVEALKKDTLRKPEGTLRELNDMIAEPEKLLMNDDWQHWPKHLPLLVTHGTGDEVNSHKAAEEFFNKVQIDDKKLVLYPGAYHDLFNEAEGIPEKVIEEYISWLEAHIPGKTATA